MTDEFICSNCDKSYIVEHVSMNTRPPFYVWYTCKNCGHTKFKVEMADTKEYNELAFQDIHNRYREFEKIRAAKPC